MGENNAGFNLIVGLTIGLVAGVALGLVLAPKEGRETRAMVREAISSGMERVRRRDQDESTDEG
jgi:gas vesicle protein